MHYTIGTVNHVNLWGGTWCRDPINSLLEGFFLLRGMSQCLAPPSMVLTGIKVSWFSCAPLNSSFSLYICRNSTKKHPAAPHRPSYLPTKTFKPWHDRAAHTNANHAIHGSDPLVLTKGSPHGCIILSGSGGDKVEIKYYLVYY